MSPDDRVARPDFVRLHIALARRALGIPVEVPGLDGPVPLFADDDELDDTVARHPSNGPDEAA